MAASDLRRVILRGLRDGLPIGLGYFAVDNKDSAPEHLVFNRAVALKDSFKK